MELKDTPDEALNSFKDFFLTAVDKNAPLITRRVRGKILPWMRNEIKSITKERDMLHKKAIKTNKEVH